MTSNQFVNAHQTLGWTHAKLAEMLGVSRRCTYRYQNGDTIPEPVQRLLRLLVMMRLTTSKDNFEKFVQRL